MSAAEQEAKETKLKTPVQEPAQEWLTDVIDQWKRNAFRRSLERRHARPPVVVESAHLVRTSSS
jgi:hypothetical protein